MYTSFHNSIIKTRQPTLIILLFAWLSFNTISCSGSANKLIGKRAFFYEKTEYILESAFGGLVNRTVTYRVKYTCVIESVLELDVKVIIKDAEIQDPEKVSYSYLENRNSALAGFKKNIGKTRVLSKSEIEVG